MFKPTREMYVDENYFCVYSCHAIKKTLKPDLKISSEV